MDFVPEERYLTMRLTYHDSTPDEYQPPFFQGASNEDEELFETNQTFNMVTTNLDSCGDPDQDVDMADTQAQGRYPECSKAFSEENGSIDTLDNEMKQDEDDGQSCIRSREDVDKDKPTSQPSLDLQNLSQNNSDHDDSDPKARIGWDINALDTENQFPEMTVSTEERPSQKLPTIEEAKSSDDEIHEKMYHDEALEEWMASGFQIGQTIDLCSVAAEWTSISMVDLEAAFLALEENGILRKKPGHRDGYIFLSSRFSSPATKTDERGHMKLHLRQAPDEAIGWRETGRTTSKANRGKEIVELNDMAKPTSSTFSKQSITDTRVSKAYKRKVSVVIEPIHQGETMSNKLKMIALGDSSLEPTKKGRRLRSGKVN